MNGAAEPALFGKLPTRGDFLRVGPLDEAARFIESWLTTAVEQSRGELAPAAVRFLVASGQDVLLGCWVPSRDEIGRRFPLIYFGRVPRDVAELGWSLLLGLHETFLSEVEALLARACAETGAPPLEAIVAELASFTRPHPSELVRAVSDARARLAGESVSGFEQRVFGALDARTPARGHPLGAEQAPMPYALLTLSEAARRSSADPTLDVPAPSAFDLFVWLELAGCFASEPRFPSLTWCPQQARALVAPGAPSPLTMAFLVDPRHASNSRWPVWTERAAGAQAIQQLSQAVQGVLAAQGSLAELAAALRVR